MSKNRLGFAGLMSAVCAGVMVLSTSLTGTAAFGSQAVRTAAFPLNGATLHVRATETEVSVCDPDKGALGIPHARLKFSQGGSIVYVSTVLFDKCYPFQRSEGFPDGPYEFIVVDIKGERVLIGSFILGHVPAYTPEDAPW